MCKSGVENPPLLLSYLSLLSYSHSQFFSYTCSCHAFSICGSSPALPVGADEVESDTTIFAGSWAPVEGHEDCYWDVRAPIPNIGPWL